MRKVLLAAAIVALLAALYAAAGYWLAPRFVHDALMEQAARLGLALELGEVRADPFALTVAVNDVRVLADGRELARAESFHANLAWASLWGEAWHVQRAVLREPRVALALGPQNELNWPLAGRTAGGGGGGRPPALLIDELAVTGGALRFVDRSRAAPVELELEAIDIRAGGLSTRAGGRARYELSARTAQGGSLSSRGSLALEPLSAQGRLELAAMPLATVWSLAAPASDPARGQVQGAAAYVYDGAGLVFTEVSVDASVAPGGSVKASGRFAVSPFAADLQLEAAGLPLAQAGRLLPQDLALTIASGALSASGRARIRPEGASYQGSVSVRNARLDERDSGEQLLAWESLHVDKATLSSSPFRAELGDVVAQAPAGRLAIGKDGESSSGKAPPHVTVERLQVRDGTLQLAHPALELAVRGIQGAVAGFSTSAGEPARVELRAASVVLPSGETIPVSASGTVRAQPVSADLRIKVDGVPLAQANRWVPQHVAVNVASGRLTADGRLVLGPKGARYEGALAVRDARLEERGSGELLLAWETLRTDEATLAFAPFRAELGEVVAQAPAGRLVIGKDGRVNFAALFGKDAPAEKDAPLQVAVRRLRIENGTLDFADRSLENDFAVTVRELAGAVTGFSTEPGNPARIQLSGRVAQYGSARIRGSIDLDAPKSLTSVVGTFRNVPLAALTPYIVKFAGYRVESGRVSAELRYRVRDGRLVGQNELTFEELELGEKVQSAGARDLPLELAVALLADSKGRINLDIPVSGNLNDPQFDFGGLVARALGNVLGKIASAPFRLLAGALGKGAEDLDRVAFAPGSAALSPPAEETVAQVARALGERPRLNVAVQGGYDPQADVEALRRDTARRAIAQRAGVEGKGPLDFGDPRVLQAAERLYLERVGNRLEMLALRDAQPRYGRALLDKLAAVLQADPQSAQTLARARAETVRAALLAHGVDSARVRLEAPDRREAGKEGVPTVLAVDTGRSAAAGATR
jgi:hypothetical protein